MSLHHVKYLLIGGGAAASTRAGDPPARRRGVGVAGGRRGQPAVRPADAQQGFLRRERNKTDLYTLPAGGSPTTPVQCAPAGASVRLDVARDTATLDSGEDVTYDRPCWRPAARRRRWRSPARPAQPVLPPHDRGRRAAAHRDRQGQARGPPPRPRARQGGGRRRRVARRGGRRVARRAGSTCRSSARPAPVGQVRRRDHRQVPRPLPRTGRGGTSTPTRPAGRLEGDGRVQRVIRDFARSGAETGRPPQTCPAGFVRRPPATRSTVERHARRRLRRRRRRGDDAKGAAPRHAAGGGERDSRRRRCGTNHPHVYAAGDCFA